MAKSIRSKVKRRFRTAKRGVVKRTVTADRTVPILSKLDKAGVGDIESELKPRNAFRSDGPDVAFPQHTFTPCTDFRSQNVTESMYAGSGNRRATHPINIVRGVDGEESVTYGPGGGAADGGDADEAMGGADEVVHDAAAAKRFEDDRMNYDGTTKSSSRERRRNRNKPVSQQGGDPKGSFSFWDRKIGKTKKCA
ncbi:hypothetical protein T492DRAFT_961107 [Pavlovales sp. CCMP2436]|nr:hypothetical protein T492DRAFT_961107 [Pavlovales sp. CCMP2436]